MQIFLSIKCLLFICTWELVKHPDCLGDNRKTNNIRKIKLCGLKACCLTLTSYSISHNFPPENVDMKSLKVS